eukprot:TRINITY_DN8393_c1_g1_i1.p2 TRINITY_DN8393_c1_g1~~TRINITY_DN8393_c1_g1_i1.p2  ORF type:complete len:393 (+),score=41.64 TRINITY_DN8393_c1_g1_i1:5704-6882(+)
MVKELIRNCDICQRRKHETLQPAGLLQPLPIPDHIWTDISMDFVEGLPPSSGYTVVLVVVDRLSKYMPTLSLKHPFTAVSDARAFLNHVVRLHGMPSSIISDRDKVFVSTFWETLFQLQGTQLKRSSSYHLETDGQTEVANRMLEQNLQCFTYDQARKWADWLAWAEYSYNTTVHSATTVSPFEAVYGIPPLHLTLYVSGMTKVAAVDDFLRTHETILKELHRNLLVAQNRMKTMADKHRRDVVFHVGDYVFLRLRPYRQATVVNRPSQKLAPRVFGPFQVLARIGSVAYRLELPPGSQVHNVFHVSLLKKYVGPSIPVSPEISTVSNTSDSPCIPQPEVILASRIIHKGKYHPGKEVLVQWFGAPPEDAPWENSWRFSRMYPGFVLEDKDI